MPFPEIDCAYEELTFIPHFISRYRPVDYDVTLTCSYPFTNWMLRRPALARAALGTFLSRKTAIGLRMQTSPSTDYSAATD